MTIHPRTAFAWTWAARVAWARAAWAAAIRLTYEAEGLDPDTLVQRLGVGALAAFGVRANVGPYDHRARASWKYERMWDAIEAAYARRQGTALWWEEGLAAVEAQRRERAERARQEAALAEVRARLATRGQGASVEDRARAWLGYRDAGSSRAAFSACVGLVRGFALDPGAALALLRAEYEPRFHRKFLRGELEQMVRRAARASKPVGYLLTEDRRR